MRTLKRREEIIKLREPCYYRVRLRRSLQDRNKEGAIFEQARYPPQKSARHLEGIQVVNNFFKRGTVKGPREVIETVRTLSAGT